MAILKRKDQVEKYSTPVRVQTKFITQLLNDAGTSCHFQLPFNTLGEIYPYSVHNTKGFAESGKEWYSDVDCPNDPDNIVDGVCPLCDSGDNPIAKYVLPIYVLDEGSAGYYWYSRTSRQYEAFKTAIMELLEVEDEEEVTDLSTYVFKVTRVDPKGSKQVSYQFTKPSKKASMAVDVMSIQIPEIMNDGIKVWDKKRMIEYVSGSDDYEVAPRNSGNEEF